MELPFMNDTWSTSSDRIFQGMCDTPIQFHLIIYLFQEYQQIIVALQQNESIKSICYLEFFVM